MNIWCSSACLSRICCRDALVAVDGTSIVFSGSLGAIYDVADNVTYRETFMIEADVAMCLASKGGGESRGFAVNDLI